MMENEIISPRVTITLPDSEPETFYNVKVEIPEGDNAREEYFRKMERTLWDKYKWMVIDECGKPCWCRSVVIDRDIMSDDDNYWFDQYQEYYGSFRNDEYVTVIGSASIDEHLANYLVERHNKGIDDGIL